jgi:hypothetical protein
MIVSHMRQLQKLPMLVRSLRVLKWQLLCEPICIGLATALVTLISGMLYELMGGSPSSLQ